LLFSLGRISSIASIESVLAFVLEYLGNTEPEKTVTPVSIIANLDKSGSIDGIVSVVVAGTIGATSWTDSSNISPCNS
jgi:hypothetical protein